MNNIELRTKTASALHKLLSEKGYISSVDVLLEIGVLSKADYENWRNGRVDYLERVCRINLNKLSLVNKEIRSYARNNNLVPSFTGYRKWGKGVNTPLRFSKSGNENIEKHYATHYIRKKTQ